MKGRKKTVVIVLFLVVYGLSINAQSTQYGTTWEYKGSKDKTPLSGVNVVAGGATAKSDKYGNFKLQFNGLKIGDRINVDITTVATLKGYVLFNRDALEQWYVTKKSESFRIVMCKKKMFDKLVRKYYSISDSSYREQYRKECLRVEQLLKQGEIQKQEYERMLKEAEMQHEQDMKNIAANAELLARIDESELEGEQLQIHQLLSEGKVDEAVKLINPEKSMETLDKIAQKSSYIDEEIKKLDQKRREAKEERERQVARMKFEMNVFMTEGGRKNLETCGQYWEKIIMSDTTDLMNVWNGASFFGKQHDYERAEKYYRMAMRQYERLATKNPMAYAADYASVLNNLAIIYHERHQMDTAEVYHLKAMSMLRYLVEKGDSATYMPVYASSLSNVANLYADNGRGSEAERYMREALEIRKRLAEADPEVYKSEYATTLSNAGALYHSNKEYERALELHAEALRIRREVAESDTTDTNEDIATSLNNLANTYADLKRYEEAKGCYVQAIRIRQAMAVANPDAYNPDYAMSLFNLALLSERMGELDTAEQRYQEALEIRRVMAEKSPEAYKPFYAQSLFSLAVLYSKQGAYNRAEEYYLKVLEAVVSLEESHPTSYIPECFSTLANLSKLYDNGKGMRPDSALVYYEYEAKVLEGLMERDSMKYMPYYASTMHTMGRIYGLKHEMQRSEECFERAIECRKRMADVDPFSYNKYYAISMYSYAALLYNQEKRDSAKAAYKQLLPVCRTSMDGRVSAAVLERLAGLSVMDSLYEEADGYYQSLVEVYRGLAEQDSSRFAQRLENALSDEALCLYTIGALHNNAQRYDSAEVYMRRAVELRREVYERNHSAVGEYRQAVEAIVNIYKNLKREDMAEEYRKVMEEIK